MMNEILFNPTIAEVIRDPQSKNARAFFNGARAVMAALGMMTPAECQQALSAKNQQHIIAMLVNYEESQRQRRRQDMEALLKIYRADKVKVRGFIFDVPAVDTLSGRAIDEYGNYLENEEFQLLPEYQNACWPNYKIISDMDDTTITREEYLALDEGAQYIYSYICYFMLETAGGKSALQVSSADACAMETLIRQDILIGDLEVNRRYIYAITSDDPRYRKLKRYHRVVMDSFKELNYNGTDFNPLARAKVDRGVANAELSQ